MVLTGIGLPVSVPGGGGGGLSTVSLDDWLDEEVSMAALFFLLSSTGQG